MVGRLRNDVGKRQRCNREETCTAHDEHRGFNACFFADNFAFKADERAKRKRDDKSHQHLRKIEHFHRISIPNACERLLKTPPHMKGKR